MVVSFALEGGLTAFNYLLLRTEIMPSNIHPVFDNALKREAKEHLLGQRGLVIWFTGLSGSGKSTLAIDLENRLNDKGVVSMLLDGDNIRTGLNEDLGFSGEERRENIRRIAEVSKLFLNCGVVCICSFVSPTIEIRNLAKQIIGKNDFHEVYVNASFDTCAKRDVKGLYKKALNGEIKGFTGLDAPFEAPRRAFLEVNTENDSPEESGEKLFDVFFPLAKKK
jgi:adenylylsulfate kinase